MKKNILKIGMLLVTTLLIGTLQGCSEKKEPVVEEVPEGSILWEFKAQKSIVSEPVIYKDTIIFASSDQNVYAVDLETHEEKWKFRSDGVINNSLRLEDDTVIFSSIMTGSSCYAIDANTGEEKWVFNSDKAANITLGGYGGYDYHSPSPVLYKESVIFPSKSGDIYSLNKKTGQLEWQYKDPECSNVVATPSISEDILCVGDVGGNCFAIDLNTKKTLWSHYIGDYIIQGTVAYKNYAYFSGRNAQVIAYDIKDGTEKWAYRDPGSSWYSGDMIALNDVIYAPGSDNFKVDGLSYDTGKKVNSYVGRGNIFSKPVISNDKMIFTAGDVYNSSYGTLTVSNLETREKIMQRSFDKPLYSTPIEKDGIVYVGGTDGTLYAIDINS